MEDIWIFNSIACIGSFPDILRFREYLLFENSDIKYPLTIYAWIYIPKTIEINKNNMTELVTAKKFIFLMELKKRCPFGAGCFANKSFSKCIFILRVSCDWDTEQSNHFTRVQIWQNSQKIFEKKTIKIELQDNDIISDYHWLLRYDNEWRSSEKCPQNDKYIYYKTIYEYKDKIYQTKRDCVIADTYHISLKQLWIHYIRNVLCKENFENYSILVVVDIIADFL
eukprot:UN07609